MCINHLLKGIYNMAKYRKKGQIDVYEKEKSSGCGTAIAWIVIIFIGLIVLGAIVGD